MTVQTRLAAALDELVSAARRDPPHLFAQTVGRGAALLGSRGTRLLVQDYGQQELVDVESGDRLDVERTTPGHAFTSSTVVGTAEDGQVRLWVPLRDSAERVGVLGLLLEEIDASLRRDIERFASLVAELLPGRGRVTDRIARRRRTHDLRTPAEMQWQLLPPLALMTEKVDIAGIVEPAYEVGGDVFDYAFDEALRFAVFDAMGHGMQSSLTAALVTAVYRHARRSRASLEETYARIDAEVATHRPANFATAILAELAPDTGQLRFLVAGHPVPKLLRDGMITDLAPADLMLPLGLARIGGERPVTAAEVRLGPGDCVLLYTDGAVEVRNEVGEAFGVDRLHSLVATNIVSGVPPDEVLRRVVREVVRFGASGLRDDATIVLVVYASDRA